eukprot:2498469-Karenia_brevis.AAC.1
MPAVYRIWAKARLLNLGKWISSWQTTEMFAGRPGAGAQDAWYLAALDLEQAQVLDADYVGGTLDLFKCFDQIV